MSEQPHSYVMAPTPEAAEAGRQLKAKCSEMTRAGIPQMDVTNAMLMLGAAVLRQLMGSVGAAENLRDLADKIERAPEPDRKGNGK